MDILNENDPKTTKKGPKDPISVATGPTIPASSAPVTTPPVRGAKGHFAKGNKMALLGATPFKQLQHQYRYITYGQCTAAAWKKIVDKAIEQAQKGDAKAREWLSDRVCPPAKAEDEAVDNAVKLIVDTITKTATPAPGLIPSTPATPTPTPADPISAPVSP